MKFFPFLNARHFVSLHGEKFVMGRRGRDSYTYTATTNIYKNNINGIKMRYFIVFGTKRQSEWTFFIMWSNVSTFNFFAFFFLIQMLALLDVEGIDLRVMCHLRLHIAPFGVRFIVPLFNFYIIGETHTNAHICFSVEYHCSASVDPFAFCHYFPSSSFTFFTTFTSSWAKNFQVSLSPLRVEGKIKEHITWGWCGAHTIVVAAFFLSFSFFLALLRIKI